MRHIVRKFPGIVVLAIVLSRTSVQGKTCAAGETLCYDNPDVINAFCIEAGSTDKCCHWVHPFTTTQTATRCQASQLCCDITVPSITTAEFGGYCCDAGSTCCKAGSLIHVFGTSACCPAGGKCCHGSMYGFCCAADEECDESDHRCIPPPGGRAPPATPAPVGTPAPPITCRRGEWLCGDSPKVVNQFCIEAGSTDKCCQWDLPFSTSKTVSRCHANQECCGISTAAQAANALNGFCCNAGSVCCTAGNKQNLFATAACCPAGGKCCQGSSFGFCCNAKEKCNLDAHVCVSDSSIPPIPGLPPGPINIPPIPGFFGTKKPTSPPAVNGNPVAAPDAPQPGSSPTTASPTTTQASTVAPDAAAVVSVVALMSSATAVLFLALA